MGKNIVFCADGTWNGPGTAEDVDRSSDHTNVYKLFLNLDGDLATDSLLSADEQEKELAGPAAPGSPLQVAKYIHGVGDSRNPIIRMLGGAFGSGIISRIVRGYTFISRSYAPGDRIHIVGFSRGAYTARALAGLIVSQGLLPHEISRDKQQAYRRGAEAWYGYRKATITKPFQLAHLAEIAANLPAFMSQGSLKGADMMPVERIASVAVWDTVGALGIPDFGKGSESYDAFRFADTKLSPMVESGFHAVALDEQRDSFIPTLWDEAGNVTQMLFAGAHADVGGGYPLANDESCLSDIALGWMTEKLTEVGVHFAKVPKCPITPNACGPAHMPWTLSPWNLPGFTHRPRTTISRITPHPTIEDRKARCGAGSKPGGK